MSRRKPPPTTTPLRSPPAADQRALWLSRLRQCSLGGAAALLVATVLIPTERAELTGSMLPVAMLWLLLGVVWFAGSSVLRGESFRWGPTLWAMLALVAWQAISSLVMASQGSPRQTFNMMWTWVSYGAALMLLLQLLRTMAEVRALSATMVALGVLLATLSFWQYFVSMPADREFYRQNPEAALQQAQVNAPEGSIARKHFESRLSSVEPTATFSLTNSLAGYLAPWLILAISIAVLVFSRAFAPSLFVLILATSILPISMALLLTKSRTANLAALVGVGVVAAAALLKGRRLPGWSVAIFLGLPPLLLLTVVLIGGLDAQVFSEAPKSVLYRLEYWQSTASMIAEHPWFGCGPGNFQEFYTAYKLPQASETIADPHNFLFEVAATGGLPALAALVAMLGCFSFECRRGEATSHTLPRDNLAEAGHVVSIYCGAALGIVFSLPLSLLAGVAPEFSSLTLGAVAAAVCLLSLQPWVKVGGWPNWLPLAAIITLLFNLLAAGGIGFPAVANSLWVLMATALAAGASSQVNAKAVRRVLPISAGMFALLLVACYLTAYNPVLRSRNALLLADEANMRGDNAAAEEGYLAAARLDPWSAEPHNRLAHLYFEHWRQTPTDAAESNALLAKFADEAQQALARNRKMQVAHSAVGYLYLEAFELRNSPGDLEEATKLLEESVALAPNDALAQAELAWALHLGNNETQAATAADAALKLDAANPHEERKLRERRLFSDVTSEAQQARMPSKLRTMSAEQLMQSLRKTKREEPLQ